MKVLILGCGPAGLMAAQAVEDATPHDKQVLVGIASRKQKSPLYGAQYLHRPIPGHTENDGRQVDYLLRGDPMEYRNKVYGMGWTGSVSPEDMEESHTAWDIRQTYDSLWEKWEHAITDTDITPYGLKQMIVGMEPDIVISSIPRQALCEGGDRTAHFFNQIEVVAAGDAPELGIDIGKMYRCPDETIICSGNDLTAWYRMSRVFGHTTVEWPGSIERVPITSAARVSKPLNTNCDCWEGLMFVGRYGRWEKGVLSDSAYYDVLARIDLMWIKR